jgi:hypothetical protein
MLCAPALEFPGPTTSWLYRLSHPFLRELLWFSRDSFALAEHNLFQRSIKSTAGGLINTAFQIGTAVGLALCGVVFGSVPGHQSDADDWARMKAYSAALWMSTGLVSLSFLIALFGIKGGQRVAGSQAPVH